MPALFSSVSNADFVLVSKENGRFPVNRTLLKSLSLYVQTTPETEGDNDIDVPVADDATLSRVVQFCHLYATEPPKALPKPITSSVFATMVQPAYAAFLDEIPKTDVVHLAVTAHFMGMPSLHELCLCKIATLLHRKQPDALRAALGMSTAYTPDQKAAIEAETAWLAEFLPADVIA